MNTNRLNPQFTSINVRGADGDSYYNGLNVSARAANLYHQGVTLTTNYTYSHSTDNTSSTFTDGQSNGGVGGVAYLDPYNHGLDHGNSDFDVKDRISVGLLWTPPTSIRRTMLSDWPLADGSSAVSSLHQRARRSPCTDCGGNDITACPRAFFLTKPNFQRTGNSKPIAGSPDTFDYIDFPAYPQNYNVYRDPKVLTTTGVGASDLPTIINGIDTFPGMSARNAFRGPGVMSFNADLNKNFKLTERVGMQFRGPSSTTS